MRKPPADCSQDDAFRLDPELPEEFNQNLQMDSVGEMKYPAYLAAAPTEAFSDLDFLELGSVVVDYIRDGGGLLSTHPNLLNTDTSYLGN